MGKWSLSLWQYFYLSNCHKGALMKNKITNIFHSYLRDTCVQLQGIFAANVTLTCERSRSHLAENHIKTVVSSRLVFSLLNRLTNDAELHKFAHNWLKVMVVATVRFHISFSRPLFRKVPLSGRPLVCLFICVQCSAQVSEPINVNFMPLVKFIL